MVPVNNILAGYLLFGLVLIRCSGVAVFAPFFGGRQFPVRARIGMVVFFALILYPVATQKLVMPNTLNMADLALLAMQELSIGLVLGFLSSMVFMGAQLGGQLVGQQVGFALANVIDPTTDQQVSVIGFFNMNIAILIFLCANLHLLIIFVLKKSYGYLPIGSISLARATVPWVESVTVEGERMMIVALQLATPILLVMLMESVVEGFITRTMPQMNIMVLGLPLRVGLGLTALLFMLPVIGYALDDGLAYTAGNKSGILFDMIADMDEAMRRLGDYAAQRN